MLILPRFIYRVNEIPIKIPVKLFVAIEKLIFKFIWKDKETKIAQIILKGKNKIVGVILYNFKSSYKAAVIKRVCYQ